MQCTYMLFYCISDMGENGKVAELLSKSFLTLPSSSTSTIFTIIKIYVTIMQGVVTWFYNMIHHFRVLILLMCTFLFAILCVAVMLGGPCNLLICKELLSSMLQSDPNSGESFTSCHAWMGRFKACLYFAFLWDT